MLSTEAANLESQILERVVAPKAGGFSADAAQGILALKMPPRDFSRMTELAQKASAGTVTSAEREEIEVYNRIGLLLELLQSKARLSLKQG
ncbi:MAG: hypothetical protein L0Z50_13560 [Verrucomicrobiales bacterium]|nr:hypothetical protein [Verrucomicrobiales bacterium]